jgi:hypothetical protein
VVSVLRGSGAPELRVVYDGSRPPLELFSRLAAIGWDPPVPAPPPKEAIDWSTPDPVAGTRHTIRPFTATGTATLSPGRADEEQLVAAAAAAATALGCRMEGVADVDLRDGSSGPVDTGRNDGATVRVTTFVAEHLLDTALVLVGRLGLVATTDTVTTRQMFSYRGRLAESEVRAHRISVDVPPGRADDTVAALREIASSPPTVSSIDLP